MMIVSLKDVPRYERHLLFCTALAPTYRRPRQRRSLTHVAAINRSLRIHGDGVSRTWPAAWAAPADSTPS